MPSKSVVLEVIPLIDAATHISSTQVNNEKE
jgi:hypothetical protein